MPIVPPPHQEAPRTRAAERETNKIKRFLGILGPGLITGASDDDPSGIATYSAAGAALGFSTLWTALITLPMMATIQYICAKIGLVTGRGLAGALAKNYPNWVLYTAVGMLVIANTINAGADIGAIAAATNLLIPAVPTQALIFPVTLALVLGLIYGSYGMIARIFKWLTLSLLAYIATAFFIKPDWSQVLSSTFIPKISFTKDYLAVLVAILGTTISPYLFFWQSSQEVEEEINGGKPNLWQRRGASETDLKYAAVDVNVGMFFSNLVMYFIILTTAATLHLAGKTDIQTANDAALALRPLAGNMASFMFAAGLIGTGFLAIPILVGSSAYAVSEALGWRRGLDETWWRAKKFYLVIAIACAVAMVLNFLNINPMKALFWTAVINGVLAPPLLVLIMLVANNKKIMGDKVNGPLINVIGWTTCAVMAGAAIALFVTSKI